MTKEELHQKKLAEVKRNQEISKEIQQNYIAVNHRGMALKQGNKSPATTRL